LGDHAGAARVAQKLPTFLAKGDVGEARDEYAAATLLSRCAGLAGPDSPHGRKYGAWAVDRLRRALAAGDDKVDWGGETFQPLQGREAFRTLKAGRAAGGGR